MTMENGVIPSVETALKIITGSSGLGPNSIVQNPDYRDFWRNTEDTPPKLASRCNYLNISHNRNDETQNKKTFRTVTFRHKCLFMNGKHSVVTVQTRFIVFKGAVRIAANFSEQCQNQVTCVFLDTISQSVVYSSESLSVASKSHHVSIKSGCDLRRSLFLL